MNSDGGQSAKVASPDRVRTARTPEQHRVLLVEDHAALAEATAELMRFHGLEVRVATSGKAALEMAGAFNPGLILCDIMLPDMTGFDVGQALHAAPGANNRLIALYSAMSANDLRELEREWKPRGVDLCLPKPLTNETVVSLLSKLDDVKRLRPDAV